MYLPEPLIIDNLLPQKYADEIERHFLDSTFPWAFNTTVEVADEDTNQIGFSHIVLFYPDYIEKDLTSLLLPLTYIMEDKSGIECNAINRIRIGLFPKDTQGPLHHKPHVDYTTPHYVGLYYVNDSDGPTHIFNERVIPDNSNLKHSVSADQLTLQTTVEPKKNRIVIFDGLQYHASSSPKDHYYRMAININFV